MQRSVRGAVLIAACLATASPTSAEKRLLEALAFSDASSATLDLYLPEPDDPPAPLLVFVDSRFWGLGVRKRDVAHRLARPLQRLGVAVAIVRHRSPADGPHPAPAEDVAAAIAYLLGRTDTLGLDRERIVLAGHGSGAHLAALVAIDPRYLGAHELDSRVLHGVAAISGVYDLSDDDGRTEEERELHRRMFGGKSARRDASPLRYARADAPTLMALAAQQDAPGAREAATALAKALRAKGHPAAEAFFVGGHDHWSQLDLRDERNPLRQHLLAMLGSDETYGSIEEVIETRRFWRDPSLSTRGFWEGGFEVTRYDADERFLHTLNLLFAKSGRPRPLWPRHYHAIDLLDFVEQRSRQTGQSGDYLTVENARGEQMVWQISELRPFGARIVVGLDDERELFRLTDVYHTRRRYTWKDREPKPWVLARPLGAFIHFRDEPPPRLEPGLFGRFGLLPEGFSRSEADPLAPLRTLTKPQRSLVIDELRCVSCHQLRGVGARAAHLKATDASKVGGFGLPLEEYPREVWRRYCFEQEELAAEIGASPVALGERAQLLFELVEAERGP